MSIYYSFGLIINRKTLLNDFNKYFSDSELVFKHHLHNRQEFLDSLFRIQEHNDYAVEKKYYPEDDISLDCLRLEIFSNRKEAESNHFLENSNTCSRIVVDIRSERKFTAQSYGDFVCLDIEHCSEIVSENTNLNIKKMMIKLIENFQPFFGFQLSDWGKFAYSSFFESWKEYQPNYLFNSRDKYWHNFYQEIIENSNNFVFEQIGSVIWLQYSENNREIVDIINKILV